MAGYDSDQGTQESPCPLPSLFFAVPHFTDEWNEWSRQRFCSFSQDTNWGWPSPKSPFYHFHITNIPSILPEGVSREERRDIHLFENAGRKWRFCFELLGPRTFLNQLSAKWDMYLWWEWWDRNKGIGLEKGGLMKPIGCFSPHWKHNAFLVGIHVSAPYPILLLPPISRGPSFAS